MEVDMGYVLSFSLFLLPLILLLLSSRRGHITTNNPPPPSSASAVIPKAYPIIGSVFSIASNNHRRVLWIADILHQCPSSTFTLQRSLGCRHVFTANPSVVQHILKSHFPMYHKGQTLHRSLGDFLGNGIFNADGHSWKFQRQLSSHEFNTRSLRKFVETVVDTELTHRLLPILSSSSSVLDFQDILQRFTFDNICRIAFGFDPAYLLPSLPHTTFATAFEEGTRLSSERFNAAIPLLWKIKKLLDIGSERRLRVAIAQVRDLANKIVREKKQELKHKSSLDSVDLLSRFLNSGISDQDFVTDIVISFILAGRDTTSAALTWFFWLLRKHPNVEEEIMTEIKEKSDAAVYDEVKDMVYTHAALCESMRLYPPVPVDTKEAAADDVLPDGTFVRKGTRVAYHVYAMGRSEKLWGPDWAQFRPERWLKVVDDGPGGEEEGRKWKFVAVDPFTYPVFQAGPRVCLGKEMAFLQMKRIVGGVLKRFRVVPVAEEDPVYTAHLTSLMKDGFPVRFEKRSDSTCN